MLESVYKTCLAYRLQKRGLLLETEKPVPVFFEEVKNGLWVSCRHPSGKTGDCRDKIHCGYWAPAGGTSISVASLFGIEVWFDSQF
jgi:hypothetical protein